MPEDRSGDSINIGDISSSRGIAVGRGAKAHVTEAATSSMGAADMVALRGALEKLYEALSEEPLPPRTRIASQTVVGTAIASAEESAPSNARELPRQIETIGNTLQAAGVTVRHGTSLWKSIKDLASAMGPIVGGASVVAGWFGLH